MPETNLLQLSCIFDKEDSMRKEIQPTRAVMTLKSAGISTTQQRLAVLNILQQATKPLSVGDIRKKLESVCSVNKVTIYRIITLLKKQRIIRDISSASGSLYFEMATSDHPVHPHFNCTNCGTVNCLTPLTFSQARQILRDPPDNFSVDHIEINISGLCNGCLHATKLQKQTFKKGQK